MAKERSQFKPMKAGDYEADKQRFPCLASPKIDGFRAVKIPGVDKLVAYSLKPFPNPYVQELFGRPQLDGFDGELTVGAPNAPDVIQRTAEVMRLKGEPNVWFNVFDYFGNPDLAATDRQTILQTKLAMLREEFPDAEWLKRVTYVNQTVLATPDELDDYEARALAHGYEGVVTRAPDNAYKYGRSTTKEQTLIKVKRFVDSEAVIEGFSPAQHNTNTAIRNALGRLERSSAKAGKVDLPMVGKIHVFDFKGPGDTYRSFDIGPGTLTHKQREDLWRAWMANPQALKGLIVTYKHLLHGEKDNPRHGNFKCFRDPLTIAND